MVPIARRQLLSALAGSTLASIDTEVTLDTFEGGLTPPYSVYNGCHEAINDTGLIAIPEVDRNVETARPNDSDDGCWQLREPIESELTTERE